MLTTQSQPHSSTRQSGSALGKIFLILLMLGIVAWAVTWANKKGYFGNISSKSFSSPMQKINPFKDEFEGFGVQVIATTSFPEAKRVMEKFALEGYSAFIVETSKRNTSLYLVRLGPYTRAEAIAVNDKIKRRYRKSPYVRDSFVVYRKG